MTSINCKHIHYEKNCKIWGLNTQPNKLRCQPYSVIYLKLSLQARDSRLIPRVTSIVLWISVVHETWTSWLYAPEAVLAVVIVPIPIVYIEIVEILTPSKATEEQRISPETRNEMELIDLVLLENVEAEIVVLGLAVDCQIRLSGRQLVLYHDECGLEDGILVESWYCRWRPICSSTWAFN